MQYLKKVLLALILGATPAALHAAAPVLFYSDLVSGPTTGGVNNKGAFVTVFGAGFGSSQGAGYVTIGGGQADNYVIWTDSKVVFQLGASAATGNIVLTNSGGSSNSLPFAVRSCDIYFVSTAGSDSNAGTYAAPFRHLSKARSTMSGGDICYIRGGTYTSSGESSSGKLFYVSGSYPWGGAGSDGAPNCMVGYPGENAVLQASADGEGIINYVGSSSDVPGSSNVLFANFTLDGNGHESNLGWRGIGNGASATTRVKNLRIVNVEVKNYYNSGYFGGTAMLEFGGDGPIDNITVLGCRVHNMDTSSKLDHGLYISAGGENPEIGWNTIYGIKKVSSSGGDGYAGYGIQTYRGSSSNYANVNNLLIHDNVIYDCPSRGGINLADYTITSKVYNNVIYNCGTDGLYEGTGMRVTVTDGGTKGTHYIYNNTFYNCGRVSASDDSAMLGLYSATYVYLRNNVFRTLTNQDYAYQGLTAGTYASSNNCWYGSGTKPAWAAAGELNSDPLIVSLPSNLHIQPASPCKAAGYDTTSVAPRDFDGVLRLAGQVDIGAYQASATVVSTHTITGYVADGANPISGATVTLSGSASGTASSDASGFYRFDNLTEGGAYTLVPSKNGYTFSPVSISTNALYGDLSNQNFAGSVPPATYLISGYARTPAASAISGALVTLSGGASTSTLTNASGFYQFGNLASLTAYTVSASKAGMSFSPVSITTNSLNGNLTNRNFTGTVDTYAIGGYVRDSGAIAISGALVTLSGGASTSTLTNAAGFYQFGNLASLTAYTLTPSKTNMYFTPVSITTNSLNGNLSSQNFTGTASTFTISGFVRTSTAAAISGAAVTLSGSVSSATVTNASGYYQFRNVPAGGSYTVTPAKSGMGFSPVSVSTNALGGNLANQNFTGSALVYSISGTIRDAASAAISGVTVSLVGSSSTSTVTNASGFYQFASLAALGSYTATPSKSGYTFSPSSLTVASLSGNAGGQDFTGTATQAISSVTYELGGYVRNYNGRGMGGVTVVLFCEGMLRTVVSAADGRYLFSGLNPNSNLTITPRKSRGVIFNPPNYSITNLSENSANCNFMRSRFWGSIDLVPMDNVNTGEVKVVGAAESRGAINPDKGDKASIYFKGTDAGRFTCRIFTMTGDLVWKDEQADLSEGMFEWSAAGIASGAYIVHVDGPGIHNSKKQKVVVVR